MRGRRDHAHLFETTRVAFTNARTIGEVQAALVPFGYDGARLNDALALVEAAREADAAQSIAYGHKVLATGALREATAALRARYLRHVKLARVAFAKGSAGHATLGLAGDRADDLAGLLAQARTFYHALRDVPEFQATMARLTVDAAAVADGLADVEAVERARTAQAREIGDAQAATRHRDEAVARLREVWREFRVVAEIALEGQPQAREMLGLLERS